MSEKRVDLLTLPRQGLVINCSRTLYLNDYEATSRAMLLYKYSTDLGHSSTVIGTHLAFF